jgi:DNA helicase-2/ATP-dependent DNA helicase PcrA
VRGGADQAPAGERDAVEVATFHAAKGLEWHTVFVAGLERGFVPVGHAATPEARAEERRLLYVALTRATRELRCSWAGERTFAGRPMPRRPSPFLDAIERAIAGLTPGSGPGRWAAGSGARARTVVVERPATDVLDALRAWRSAAARAAGVPPRVVFADRTLELLAASRPTSAADLRDLPGMGPLKAARYGDDLLALLAPAG